MIFNWWSVISLGVQWQTGQESVSGLIWAQKTFVDYWNQQRVYWVNAVKHEFYNDNFPLKYCSKLHLLACLPVDSGHYWRIPYVSERKGYNNNVKMTNIQRMMMKQ